MCKKNEKMEMLKCIDRKLNTILALLKTDKVKKIVDKGDKK